jgi:hypothetical protein
MQKIIFPLALLMISLTACAQESHLDQFYHKFNDASEDGVNGSINPAFLLSMSGSLNTGSADSAKNQWIRKITHIRFLSIDGAKTPATSQEWSELTRSLKDDEFEEWFSVREGKGTVRVLSRDGKDGQEEVVCVIGDKDGSGLVFQLKGRFSAADKARMMGAFKQQHS